MPFEPLVLVLVGPTASGKTALLDELFGSGKGRSAFGLPAAEVISAELRKKISAVLAGK